MKLILHQLIQGRTIIVLAAFTICLLFNFQFLTFNFVRADSTDDDITNKIQANEQQISQLQSQLDNSQKQETTLQSQLNIINGQTKVTELKIEDTSLQIEKLTGEIDQLSTRITRISSSVDTLYEILLQRIVQTYEHGSVSTLELLFSSNGFADALERIKYLQVTQANDKKVLYQLQATKAAYNDQIQDKQTRQQEAEELNTQLADYQKQLNDQKTAKQELLSVTKNEESHFQTLITQLQADTDSLTRALSGGGVSLGDHNRGDRIAVVGDSGCSTGPHIHFEVMTPAHIEQVGNSYTIIGSQNKVDPRPYINSGQLAKPVNEYDDNDSCSKGGACHYGDISTTFHQWYYVLSTAGSAHTGLDIVDYYGAPIYAADKGTVYAFQDSQPCSLTGTVGKGVAIDHHNGMVTLYWHIP